MLYVYPWPEVKPSNSSGSSLPAVLMNLLVYIVDVEKEQINIVFISNSPLQPNQWWIQFTSLPRWFLLKQKNLKTIILVPVVAWNTVLNSDSFLTDQREAASHNGCWWIFLLFFGESSSAEGLMVGSETAWWFREHVWNVGQRNTVIFLVSSSNCVAFHPGGPSGGQMDEPLRFWECRCFVLGLFFGVCVCVCALLILVFQCLCSS